MQDLIIAGAGGFGRELLQMIKEINEKEPIWNVLGFLDDNIHALDGVECSHQVIGTIQDWKPDENQLFAIALAAPAIKKKAVVLLKERGAHFATLMHPTSKITDTTRLGEGVILAADVSVSVNTIIGDFVFMNHLAGIGHDCVIGGYSMIGPRSSLSGYTVLGEGVTVGAHACTHPGIKVGEYATLGMNSVAVRNIKAYTTVFGMPAKRI